MTLVLRAEEVEALATPSVALDAVRAGFEAEARGRSNLPVRLDSPSPTGFIRVMPAVLDDVMGLKVMTLVEGEGTRYLVLLYSVETGEALALMDADELTRIRTAATTLLAGVHMVDGPPEELAVIGSGFEARGHLEVLTGAWPIRAVRVYSRSHHNRRQFAQTMQDKLGVEVRATTSCRQALQSATTVLLATKSPTPVLDGGDLLPGSVVLSIGSTRPDLRELDERTLERAQTLVVDAKGQVLHESGDIIAGLDAGVFTEERIIELADLCATETVLERASGTRDLTVFKSVGTALQDLALARSLYEFATSSGLGRDIGELSRLKSFT